MSYDIYLKCCYCELPLTATFYGAGDGSGDRYACQVCWLKHRIKELEAEALLLRAKIAVPFEPNWKRDVATLLLFWGGRVPLSKHDQDVIYQRLNGL